MFRQKALISCLTSFPREVPLKDAKEYAESIGALVVETSAKNAINIEELFQGISKCQLVSQPDLACTIVLWGRSQKPAFHLCEFI